jgi:aryl-alcohol dehydrogenase-like predicted oxidoreductase
VKYRILGESGLRVSEIGFGTWGLGGTAYGKVDDDESMRALEKALDLGINFFDTSDIYGDGHSETVLGKALAGRRKDTVIATKFGTLPHYGFHMPQDFSPAHIKKAIEASLKRLGTDYVDLYQLHSPLLREIDIAAVKRTLENLKAEGKIRHYGASVRSPADGLAAVEEFGFQVVQVNYNVIDQRARENGLFALAGRGKAGLIGRTPLCFGFLTGRLSGDTAFESLDHRANWPKEQLKRWADSVGLFQEIIRSRSWTPAQFALRFCLDFPALSTIIPGILSVEHAVENAGASDLPPLTEEERESAIRIYQANTFYDPSIKAAKGAA